MSSIPTKQIDGDIAVGRNVSAGGNANIQGNVRVGHDLKVEGWFDANNIKGPVKGLFLTEAKLKAAYQFPEEGWYALVGTTLPAALYVAEGGEWKPTGQNAGSPGTDLTEYRAELEALQAQADNNELQSVAVTAGNNSATLTVKSKGKTISCAMPFARNGAAGFITGEQSDNLDAANKRDNTYPVNTVATLRTGSSLTDGYLGSTVHEVEAAITQLELDLDIGSYSQINAWVETDTEAVQLNIRFQGSPTIYFADEWGDWPEVGIASSKRYRQAAALLVDVVNSKTYMWSDDQSSLFAFMTETDKGIEGGIATLGTDGKVPAAQIPQDVYEVQGYDSDKDAAGVAVSNSEIAASYRVVWLLNSDGTGRFAAEPVTAVVGQPLYARWPGSERMCNANGRPLPGKLYLRKSDRAIMTVADGGQKLERAGGMDIDAIKGVPGGIAPLGADGKVPASCLPAQDATIRFAEVVRSPGAAINSGQPGGNFSVVWLDNSAATDYVWKAPGARETPLTGRFVARAEMDSTEVQSLGDSDISASTVSYYADWAGRASVCSEAGVPLKGRVYMCGATGRQYDRPATATGIRCIAAPPMDAKKALLADLWNEACCNEGWGGNPATRTVHGYYDADADKWLLNGLTLSYDEAIAVWYAGTPREYDATNFYGGWHTIRTNLPPRKDGTNLMVFKQTFVGCSNLEVACISIATENGGNLFYSTPKLKKVIGILYQRGGGAINPALYGQCPVEEMHFGWWTTAPGNYDLRNLPNLNAESLQWMITNAQATTSGTRQVTLHANAYARLTDEMKAQAAEKSITFIQFS